MLLSRQTHSPSLKAYVSAALLFLNLHTQAEHDPYPRQKGQPPLSITGWGQQRRTRNPLCPEYLGGGSASGAVIDCLILHNQSFPCVQLGVCSRKREGKRREGGGKEEEKEEEEAEEEAGVEACLKDLVIWRGEAKKMTQVSINSYVCSGLAL